MSTIDAVIAQARRPGNFTERKRFTLARTQAIQKLRQFALADPAAYILELVQSAVANGASWIEVLRDSDTVTVAYIGGGIPESALGRLFDFLFASKDDPGLGYLRELAIGVNALMVFEPQRIIIESGDGTLAGTSRMELLAGEDRLDVGRPDHALAGTFIRAEGLKRSRNIMRERDILEERCRAAPVPILYNSESMFGHSSQRIPSLPGVARRVSFDEGDLYGTIGIDGTFGEEFMLLSRGVLIETVKHALIRGAGVCGAVCFDGLRKTADHARFVRDDRMEEMWMRLLPHARRLLAPGEVKELALATAVDGTPLPTASALKAWMRAAKRVVIMAPGVEVASPQGRVAAAIAAALPGSLLCAARDQLPSLRLLAGSEVEIHTPDLTEGGPDVAFYGKPQASLPARPWLVQPIAAPPVTLRQLQPAAVIDRLARSLGEDAELRMRVYTPASSESDGHADVVLLSCGRELGCFALPSPNPGHVVVVELPLVLPSQLGGWTHEEAAEAGERLAKLCLRHAAGTLAEASSRLLAGLVDPAARLGALEREHALAALTRSAVLRMRRDAEGRASLSFSLVEPGPPGVDLLGLPVFTTGSGRALTARDLAARMIANDGWLRVSPHAGADGPRSEPDAFVSIDASVEAVLSRLVGEAALDRGAREGPAAFDAEGRRYTAEQVEAALREGRRIVVHHARGGHDDAGPGEQVPDELWLPPWSWVRLAPAGALLPAFDFHLSDAEARAHGDARAFLAAAPVSGELEGVLGVPLILPALPGLVIVDEQLRTMCGFAEIGHDYGVVGLLHLRYLNAGLTAESVTAAIMGAAEQVYQALIAGVPAMDPRGPAFARATATLLAYAGRRVSVILDPHGRVRVPGVTELADRILGLPLFPGRRGLPLAAWQLIRRFAASGGDIEVVYAELDLVATPPVLKAWIDRTLARDRMLFEPSRGSVTPGSEGQLELDRHGVARAYPEDDLAAPLDEVTLATTAEYWLHHLRPDLPAMRPWDRRGRVWIELGGKPDDDEFGALTGDAQQWRLGLHHKHWLVRWAVKTGRRDREAIAWLLLACYARINEVFDEVTNTHEGQFQHAVADALVQGRLAVVVPRID